MNIRYYFTIRRKIYEFRHDPVPYTSKRRGGRYYRRFKTYQERKRNCGDVLEGISVRGKRRYKSLPEPWDDIGRCIQKSWKEFRKKQWK